jgi:hypothetical protein
MTWRDTQQSTSSPRNQLALFTSQFTSFLIMSSNVAVAGGSQGLGRAIVDALKESGKYTTLVLSRKVHLIDM